MIRYIKSITFRPIDIESIFTVHSPSASSCLKFHQAPYLPGSGRPNKKATETVSFSQTKTVGQPAPAYPNGHSPTAEEHNIFDPKKR
jgi:hypothetical protein